MTLVKACKWVCHQSAQIILSVTMSIAEEVVAMERARQRGPPGTVPSALTTSNNCKLLGPAVYKLLLHVLTTGQSDVTLITCLDDTRKLIQDLGKREAVESSHGGSVCLVRTDV